MKAKSMPRYAEQKNKRSHKAGSRGGDRRGIYSVVWSRGGRFSAPQSLATPFWDEVNSTSGALENWPIINAPTNSAFHILCFKKTRIQRLSFLYQSSPSATMDRQTHEIPAHRPLAATHSANMQRPHRPSPLDLRSTPSIRDNLAIASAAARGPKTAPCEEPSLPTLAIQPASGTVTPTPVVFSLGPPTSPSPMSGAFQTPVARSSLRVSHKGSAASLSSFLGTCPPPARDNTQDERSNATVRGVAFDTSSIQESDCGRHCGERSPGSVDAERQPLNRYVYTRSPRYGSIRWKGDPRRTHTSRAPPREAIHGVWLAVQCWAFLAVFAVLTSMTVWQSDSSPGFCAW